ncbi:MAG: hypothetical protein ACLGHN_05735 [Bacteriovoracia bacterium]
MSKGLQKRHKQILSIIGVLVLFFNIALGVIKNDKRKSSLEENDFYLEESEKTARSPASGLHSQESPARKSSLTITQAEKREQKVFEDNQGFLEDFFEDSEDSSQENSNYYEGAPKLRTHGKTHSHHNSSPSKEDKKMDQEITGLPYYYPSLDSQLFDNRSGEADTDSSESRNNSTQSTSSPNTCSLNINGGSFQGPVLLEITCSTASEIGVCVSENYCCDPDSGSIYTGAFQLGEANKTFCISYSGTSIHGGVSSEEGEAVFTFNSNLPHLDVTVEKTHLQTTQLNGQMTLLSNDFGKPNYFMGAINLKSHDPTPSGLNLTCTDIVESHSTLTSPTTNSPLPEFSMEPYVSPSQVDLSVGGSDLAYGPNHISSYVTSRIYSVPEYACSNSNITLEDFYYSQTIPIKIETVLGVTEFIGGFTPVKTLQPDPTIYRGPATVTNIASGEELRTGIVSIFFDK